VARNGGVRVQYILKQHGGEAGKMKKKEGTVRRQCKDRVFCMRGVRKKKDFAGEIP